MYLVREGLLPKLKSEKLLPKEMEMDIWQARITQSSAVVFSFITKSPLRKGLCNLELSVLGFNHGSTTKYVILNM